MKTVVFAICSGIGYLLARFLPDGPLAAYVPLLVSYHLFLGFLVITENQKAGFSLPIGQTIVTHSAFLALLVGLAMGRHYVPFFGVIRLLIPSLAPFEATWLFGGKTAPDKIEEAPHAPVVECAHEETPEEYDEFLKYLKQAGRKFRKPGSTIQDEYVLWRADRAKQRS